MYFPDLSPYEYFQGESQSFNVGWHDAEHPYSTGEVPIEFCNRLQQLVLSPVSQTRGFHYCQFCKDELAMNTGAEMRAARLVGRIGSAEIRVVSQNGRTYAAPMMIYHYVTAHNYRPPDEFIQAVLEEAGN
jgi:hypothetical protein